MDILTSRLPMGWPLFLLLASQSSDSVNTSLSASSLLFLAFFLVSFWTALLPSATETETNHDAAAAVVVVVIPAIVTVFAVDLLVAFGGYRRSASRWKDKHVIIISKLAA